MNYSILNSKKAYAPENKSELLSSLANYKGLIIALNAEKILNKEQKLADLINSNIGYPDGIGVVRALRKKGFKTRKIAGAEFWLDIISAYSSSKSFYIIGSSESVIRATIDKLKIQFNEIKIVGFRNGFIKSEEDKKKLIDDIIAKKPDIVFVAQGTPKQEYLMEEIFQQHSALYMGLGGSLDVYCGLKNRAPRFFINTGLEWLYRLIKEPTRYKRQYSLFKFFVLLVLNKI